MSNLATSDSHEPSAALTALAQGDLSKLTTRDREAYLHAVCNSMGLNVLTNPVAFMSLQGKTVAYVTKGAADQLRRLHCVSVSVVSQEIGADSILRVRVRATMPSGRIEDDCAALSVKGLSGELLANAEMKALSKAKRRVTLAICGLGFLGEDDTEATPSANMHSERQPLALPQSPEDASKFAAIVEAIEVARDTVELAAAAKLVSTSALPASAKDEIRAVYKRRRAELAEPSSPQLQADDEGVIEAAQ